MVDVTDGPDVHMRLVALELLLRHFRCLLSEVSGRPASCGEPLKHSL
jgi:hypothetical protein